MIDTRRSIADQYRQLREAFDNAADSHATEIAFVRLTNWLWDNQRVIIANATKDTDHA